MSDVKKICQEWIDAGAGHDTFWEWWPECPSENDLNAFIVMHYIEALEAENSRLTGERDGFGALLADAYGATLDWDETLKDRANSEAKYLAERAEAQLSAERANADRLAAQVAALWPKSAGTCQAIAAHTHHREQGQ